MNNMFGGVNLLAYYGAEIREIDGEYCVCIPLKYNRSIVPSGDRAIALIHLWDLGRTDYLGNTHAAYTALPKSLSKVMPEGDYVKMRRQVGYFQDKGDTDLGVPKPPPPKRPFQQNPTPSGQLDYTSLAPRAVKDDEIPW